MLGRTARYLRDHLVLVVVLCLAIAATATATAQYITGDGSVRSVRADVPAKSNLELLEIPGHVAIIGRCAQREGAEAGSSVVYVRNRSTSRTLKVWIPDYPDSNLEYQPGDWVRGYALLTPIGGARTQLSFGLGRGKLLRISVGYADATSPYTSFEIFASAATAENGMKCPMHVRAITTNATDVSQP